MRIDSRHQRAFDPRRAADTDEATAATARRCTNAIGKEQADSDCNDGASDFVDHTLYSHLPLRGILLHSLVGLSRLVINEAHTTKRYATYRISALNVGTHSTEACHYNHK